MKKIIKKISKRLLSDDTNKSKENKKVKQNKIGAADFTDFEIDIISKTSSFTMTSPERIVSLIRATEYVVNNNIEGSIVECGVWKGGSVMAVLHTLIKLEKNKDVFLYDTYEGMAEPSDIDTSHKGEAASEMYKDKDGKWCYSSLQEVQNNIFSLDYEKNNLHFVKGDILETIPSKNTPDKIALLRLDTDWYDSTKHEMEHLFPRLVKGGIIIIDDYGHWSGCKKAIDEYLIENNIQLFLSRVDYTCRIGVKM